MNKQQLLPFRDLNVVDVKYCKTRKVITIQLTEVGEYTVTDMNLSTYESVICSIQKRPGLFDFDDILLDLTQEFPGEREDSLQSILAQVILLRG